MFDTLPKTKEQKAFEDFTQVLIKILAELPEKERAKVFNYSIALYNKEEGRQC
jgi:hypothetical protein